MLAIAATVEIHLMPDWTIFVQLGIFLLSAAVLTFFVFRPVLRLFDRRRGYTSDAEIEAGRLNGEAESLEFSCNKLLTEALENAHIRKSKEIAMANSEAERIVSDARIRAKQIAEETDISIYTSEKSVMEEMKINAEMLAGDMISRVTG